jgi:hypothetical protein
VDELVFDTDAVVEIGDAFLGERSRSDRQDRGAKDSPAHHPPPQRDGSFGDCPERLAHYSFGFTKLYEESRAWRKNI